jgi:hypothetical protein
MRTELPERKKMAMAMTMTMETVMAYLSHREEILPR